MTLLELLPYFQSTKKLQKLCRQQGISEEAIEDEDVDIYMENEKDLDSPIRLFDSTVTDYCLHFNYKGVEYINFLSVNTVAEYLQDVESDNLTDLDKAKRLLHYSIYDS